MAVFIKQVNIPQKSDLINIDMTGSGTAQTYRVIKNVGGSVVEVMSMSNASDSQQFASSGQTYENSTLDTYLNTTWYNTLSNEAKSAIVDKTFRQDSWYWSADGNPDYNGYYGTAKPGTSAYTVSLGNSSFGNEITRHIYALSIQDVLDYVLDTNITDGQLQNYNIWKMFWNDEVQHTGNNNVIWLRSAGATFSSDAFYVSGSNGYLLSDSARYSLAVRHALTIDLSKIDYTFADGRSLVELKPVSILQKSNNALSRVGLSYKVPIIYPTKSDIVDIDMTGSGTAQQYRVLKNVGGSVYEVLGMTTISSQIFNESGNIYENSNLDTYINITWYNTLSNTAKTAIVDKNFIQSYWYNTNTGRPIYQCKDSTGGYMISKYSNSNTISRHCYILDVQDIIDYLETTPQMTQANTTFTYTNLWTMFWNSDESVSESIWTSSKSATASGQVMFIGGGIGNLNYYYPNSSRAVRPAFQIDLSKIDFTIE